MKFNVFREKVLSDLKSEPEGLTWNELKRRNKLPYDRPCPEWTKVLEVENGVVRKRRKGRELLWELIPKA